MKACKKENNYLPFSPTKVTSQILVKQQLNAHYKNVQNAKATIDNKTPYSYLNNPTTRGYKRYHKPYTRTSSSPEYHSLCEAKFLVANNYSDDQTVDQIVRTFLTDNASSSRKISPVANFLRTPSRPNSPTVMQDKTLKISENGHSSSVALSRRFHANFITGDVLQMHRNKFTPEKPFSPRLIRSNTASKLRSLRCYNPPIRMVKSNSSKISQNKDQNMRPASTTDVITDPHNEKRNQRKTMKQDVRRPVSSQPCRTSLGRRLVEDDANSKLRQTPGVCFVPSPRPTQLSTEVDKKTQLPTNVSAQTSLELTKVGEWLKNLNPKDDDIPVAMTYNSTLQTVTSMEQHIAALRQTTWEESLDERQRNALLYLNFIEAVTSDVLSRGVFTDRNLNSVLSEHVIRNVYGLSKDQLRQATDQLRSQLHIKDDLGDNVNIDKFNDGGVPVPPTISDIRSGSGDLQGLGLSNQFPKKSELQFDTSVLDDLLITSPRGGALPPIAPKREVNSMSPCMPKGNHYTTSALPIRTVEGAENKVAVDNKQTNFNPDSNQGSQKTRDPENTSEHADDKNFISWLNMGTHSTESALVQSSFGARLTDQSRMDREDTLNDETTLPDLSLSGNQFDVPLGSPESPLNNHVTVASSNNIMSRTVSALRKTDIQLTRLDSIAQVPLTRPTHVTFASEAEILCTHPSELSTSLSNLTDLTRFASTDMSQQNAEFELSSTQATETENELNMTLSSGADKRFSTNSTEYSDDTFLQSNG